MGKYKSAPFLPSSVSTSQPASQPACQTAVDPQKPARWSRPSIENYGGGGLKISKYTGRVPRMCV